MKIIARECFYRQGVMALLDKMSVEYAEHGIWLSDEVFLPFFIFPANNAFAVYNAVIKQSIRSPALVFCARQAIPFFEDVYFAQKLYFVALDAACETVEKEIGESINRYLSERLSEKTALCPWQRLTGSEIAVVQHLIQGHTPSLISKSSNMSYRHISMLKRSAMGKLQVENFNELYCKIKLLRRLSPTGLCAAEEQIAMQEPLEKN
ncbi:helix-turn-helix transcriptional regulator [Dryocola sp. BD586]|uniref:helix-turn-helix transcriptional regulator n=1 Tax=Dryocola sp. BD586 TaxID=3133271 RepID=UPI003F4FFFC7